MQVRIRSPVKHDPRPAVAHVIWNPIACGVVRPRDHPMRADGNRRASPIERIRVAVLSRAAKHVYQARGFVGGSRQLFHDARGPFQAHRIGAHWDVADFVLVAGKADPFVCALAEGRQRAVVVQFSDSCVLGDLSRAG